MPSIWARMARSSNKRVFVEIEEGAGYPDGPTVDSEGCLWTGLFGGWGVRRYAPDGRLLQTVRFPVANVTKIAFGGDDLTTAYATTAAKGLDAAALQGAAPGRGLVQLHGSGPGPCRLRYRGRLRSIPKCDASVAVSPPWSGFVMR